MEYVRKDFPQLFTKTGKFSEREPKKYICTAGHEFNRTRKLTIDGFVFGRMICPKCNQKGERRKEYGIWKRVTTGQLEVEEQILRILDKRKNVIKEHLQLELDEYFGTDYNQDALGFLVYFGYLKVDTFLKDNHDIIRYSINQEMDWKKRYEHIW